MPTPAVTRNIGLIFVLVLFEGQPNKEAREADGGLVLILISPDSQGVPIFFWVKHVGFLYTILHCSCGKVYLILKSITI